MRFPENFIVDASVGVKLFLKEGGSEDAERLFALLGEERPPVIAVPDLFFLECANIFRSRVHRRLMAAEQAREAFTYLRSLPLQIVSTTDLVPLALDLALAHGLSVYDATYAALAERLGVPLVTADGKLAKKLEDTGAKPILLK
ncbi:MAG: type II toxin-antitoxin system VapC family toxin [Acidobacteriota bacterium]|nr:type II toxin-antitoxin system VapC family toxin [Acidobacteriota bacterium]